MNSKDINLFAEGATVTVVGVSTMQKVKIERISDCGVAVTGSDCGQHVMISGKSPAVLYVEPKKDDFEKVAAEEKAARIREDAQEVAQESGRAKRGSMKEKMANIVAPSGQFSVNQLADLNKIPYPYAFNWAQENCNKVGVAPRAPGQRGRDTVLYAVKA